MFKNVLHRIKTGLKVVWAILFVPLLILVPAVIGRAYIYFLHYIGLASGTWGFRIGLFIPLVLLIAYLVGDDIDEVERSKWGDQF